MANLSAYLKSTTAAPPSIHGPGSNGFLKRAVFASPGTFTWVAEKAGAIKIQAIGAAAGAYQNYPGCSGAYGEKRLNVAKGDTLTIVVGEGSLGQTSNTPANGGTTSISGSPVGGTPLTLVGALGGIVTPNANDGGPGVATGPWDTSFPGARPISRETGSPSSGSPFGPGRTSSAGARGGAGWSGVHPINHSNNQPDTSAGQPSVRSPSRRLLISTDPYEDFWDLAFAESAGGPAPRVYGSPAITDLGRLGGVGAGGPSGIAGTGSTAGLPSVLGGGTGVSNNLPHNKSGHGGGGCAWRTANEQGGGPGGDGVVLIFWDEVGS